MRPRRFSGGDRPDSLVVLSALLGIIIGSAASLWVQHGSTAHVCTPAACPTCPVCAATGAAAAGASALPAPLFPAGGTFRPAEREGGNAELRQILQRVAINDEVLVAGACTHLVGAFRSADAHCVPVSNNALITPDGRYGMLSTWVESVQRTGVKNFMVIAMDEHTGASWPRAQHIRVLHVLN